MKKNAIFVGLALIAVLVGIVMLVFDSDGVNQPAVDDPTHVNTNAVVATRPASGRQQAPVGVAKRVRRPMPQIVFDDPDYPYSPEDKRIARELQDALDDCTADVAEDGSDGSGAVFAQKQSRAQKKLMKAAAAAASSDNPSVRLRAVEAYSWIGKDALPEVTSMMADSNVNVSEQAIEAVEQSLVDIDDPGMRFQMASAYMGTFVANEDALTMLGGISSGAALELVEPASDSPADTAVALENRRFFVDTVNALVEGGQGKCIEHAQSLYEEVVGSPWIDATEGERWALDPDNYEAPEVPETPAELQDAPGAQAEPSI